MLILTPAATSSCIVDASRHCPMMEVWRLLKDVVAHKGHVLQYIAP